MTSSHEPRIAPIDETAPPERAGSSTHAARHETPGLASLHAILADVAAARGLHALTVVVDDPDLGRQAFRAGAGPFAAGALAGSPGVRAEPALPADGVEAELLVALCAATLRAEVLRGDGLTGPEGVELALRSLPGVRVVVVERDGDEVVVELLAGADAPDDLARRAARAARALTTGTLVVELTRDGEPSAPTPTDGHATDSRPMAADVGAPQVVAVRSVPEAGEIEVHVRRGDVRTVGRAPMANGLASAVAATLDALAQQGTAGDLALAWARTVETTTDRRFVVAVALQRAGASEAHHGVGSGRSPIEAAAHGALDAALRGVDA